MAFTAHVLAVAVVVMTLGFDFLESKSGGEKYHEQLEQIRSRGFNVTSSECGNTERSTKNPVKQFAVCLFFFLNRLAFFSSKEKRLTLEDRLSILSKCADGYRHSISVHGSVKKTTINVCCPVTEARYAIHRTHARQFLILNVTCVEN